MRLQASDRDPGGPSAPRATGGDFPSGSSSQTTPAGRDRSRRSTVGPGCFLLTESIGAQKITPGAGERPVHCGELEGRFPPGKPMGGMFFLSGGMASGQRVRSRGFGGSSAPGSRKGQVGTEREQRCRNPGHRETVACNPDEVCRAAAERVGPWETGRESFSSPRGGARDKLRGWFSSALHLPGAPHGLPKTLARAR